MDIKLDLERFKEKRVDYTEDSVITPKDGLYDLLWDIPRTLWHVYMVLHVGFVGQLVNLWTRLGVTKRDARQWMGRGTAVIIVIAAIGSLL